MTYAGGTRLEVTPEKPSGLSTDIALLATLRAKVYCIRANIEAL
jgi:hypothetical protein